jgi:hypothetical protein
LELARDRRVAVFWPGFAPVEPAVSIFSDTGGDAARGGARHPRLPRERCGDVIGALFAAAAAEPDLASAVAEGQRRHREAARLAVERVAELGGLRDDVTPDRAAALIALSTTHEAWRELVDAHRLSWDDVEAWLEAALARALIDDSERAPRN